MNKQIKFYSYFVIDSVAHVRTTGRVSELALMARLQDVSALLTIYLKRVTACKTTTCLCCVTDVCDSAESL